MSSLRKKENQTNASCEPFKDKTNRCLALALAPSLNTTLPNEIGHSAQERTLLLEEVLDNGTVLNMFWEPV
jgi:hypothetical protein